MKYKEVTNKKETTKPSVVLSKKEMKKKELEELENIINELGCNYLILLKNLN